MQWRAITSAFIHCVSPPECSRAQTAHGLKPVSQDSCGAGRDQRQYFCFTTKGFIHRDVLRSALLVLKISILWFPEYPPTPLSILFDILAANYKPTHQIRKHWNKIKTRKPSHLEYPTFDLSVIVWVQPSSVLLSLWLSLLPRALPLLLLWLVVPTLRQTVQTKLNQDNFLLDSGQGAGPHSQIKKSDPDRLRKTVRLFCFLHILFCLGVF